MRGVERHRQREKEKVYERKNKRSGGKNEKKKKKKERIGDRFFFLASPFFISPSLSLRLSSFFVCSSQSRVDEPAYFDDT